MPGKVNPVIPEVATQALYRKSLGMTSLLWQEKSALMELNAMEPIMAHVALKAPLT